MLLLEVVGTCGGKLLLLLFLSVVRVETLFFIPVVAWWWWPGIVSGEALIFKKDNIRKF